LHQGGLGKGGDLIESFYVLAERKDSALDETMWRWALILF
jgi:hypothetical protein